MYTIYREYIITFLLCAQYSYTLIDNSQNLLCHNYYYNSYSIMHSIYNISSFLVVIYETISIDCSIVGSYFSKCDDLLYHMKVFRRYVLLTYPITISKEAMVMHPYNDAFHNLTYLEVDHQM